MIVALRTSKNLEKRFFEKVQPEPNTGCWLWLGAEVGEMGYGSFFIGSKKLRTRRSGLAHRVSFWIAKRFLPDELCLLHKCDNPRCVNPDHLFLGTRTDNNLDMKKKGRCGGYGTHVTHCPKGHEYNEENTVFRPEGWRACRKCRTESSKRAYAKLLAKRRK